MHSDDDVSGSSVGRKERERHPSAPLVEVDNFLRWDDIEVAAR